MATPEIASQCVPFSQVPGSCSNLLGNAGRNSIVGPNVYTVDASMLKNFAVKEKTTVQFRTEFFNTLNRADFGNPSSSVSAGAPSEASPARAIPGLVNWP